LAESLDSGSLRHGISTGLLAPFTGERTAKITEALKGLQAEGTTMRGIAEVCRCLAKARKDIEASTDDTYLTLSGPPVEGIPVVSTPTVVRALFEEARKDVLVTSYVFYDAKELLAPLAARCNGDPQFRVRFIVDLSHQRKRPDEPLPVVANRFRSEFLARFWVGSRVPEFWHDPRAFDEEDRRQAGVMHAKAVVIDNSAALVTSANFTAAAQGRNIEAGVMMRNGHQVRRLRNYFEGLMGTGVLRRVE
jgi:hypothetical protein